MTRHDRAKALEALIDRYGLLVVLESMSDICDSKAERSAIDWHNTGEARAWALAQNTLREAQSHISPLGL